MMTHSQDWGFDIQKANFMRIILPLDIIFVSLPQIVNYHTAARTLP